MNKNLDSKCFTKTQLTGLLIKKNLIIIRENKYYGMITYLKS